MAESKKARNPNFVQSERNVLIDLVQEHFDVIENKRTDALSVRDKLKEWEKMSVKFNSISSVHCRTADNLKSVWDNMKKAAKKITSDERMERVKTGGGPQKKRKEDPLMDRVCALIRPAAEGMENPYDSDVLQTHSDIVSKASVDSVSSSASNASIQGEIVGVIDDNGNVINESGIVVINSEILDQDWSHYTPQMLRQPINQSLRASEGTNMITVQCDESEIGKQTNVTSTKSNEWTQRRRPTVKRPALSETLENLHKAKTEAVRLAVEQAKIEREEAFQLHSIKLQMEKEKLEQEKIRTQLLVKELNK